MKDEFIEQALELQASIERDEFKVVVFLLAKARQAAIDHTKLLISCDPDDAQSVRHFKAEVQRYAQLVKWIRDAIAEGDEALDALEPEEQAAVVAEIYGQRALNDA